MGQWKQATRDQLFGTMSSTKENNKSLLYVWSSRADLTTAYVIPDGCISAEERTLLINCHGRTMFDDDEDEHAQIVELQELLYGEKCRWQEFAHNFLTGRALSGHFTAIYHVSDGLP